MTDDSKIFESNIKSINPVQSQVNHKGLRRAHQADSLTLNYSPILTLTVKTYAVNVEININPVSMLLLRT